MLKIKNSTLSDHFWTFRCGSAWQTQGIVHLVKSEQNVRVFPHIFVWGSCFWFCIPPSASSSRRLLRPQLFTHNLSLHNLLTHNLHCPQLFTHNLSSHNTLSTTVHTQLAHTELLHIHIHTTCLTQLDIDAHFAHNLSSNKLLTHNLSHTTCHHTTCSHTTCS